MNKVQLTLTNEEVAILEVYGNQFGYTLPKTLRFIISKAAENFLKEGNVPEFQMKVATEHAGEAAVKEYKQGKTVAVQDTDHFFDSL